MRFPCPSCGKRISLSITECPECGHEVTEVERKKAKWVRYISLAIMVSAIAYILFIEK